MKPTLERWLALGEVMVAGLEAAEAEIVAVAAEQERCAQTIGTHLRGEEGHFPEVIGALQSEDLIRQHQEQVAMLLARLRSAVVDLAAMTPAAGSDADLRDRIAAGLLDGLPLEAMRQRLAARLRGTDPATPSAAVPDVELF
ncbi:MAG: hypothetical protein H7841_09110 [Magnetospirillum sp. WYHS-4]